MIEKGGEGMEAVLLSIMQLMLLLLKKSVLVFQCVVVILAFGVIAFCIRDKRIPHGIVDWLVVLAAIVFLFGWC